MAPKETTIETLLECSAPISPTKTSWLRRWLSSSPKKQSKKATKAPGAVCKKQTPPRASESVVSPKPVVPEKPEEIKKLSTKTSSSTSAGSKFSANNKLIPKVYREREWSVDMQIPYKQVDAEDVSFRHIMAVMGSWTQVTMTADWHKVFGVTMLRKMFELDAAFRVQYGFGEDCDWNCPTVYENPRFVAHGSTLIMMIDVAVNSLGPDLEPLEDELQTLGRRHIHMNALPEHWPFVGEALVYALKQILGNDAFTTSMEKSWSKVHNFLAYNMIIGLVRELAERSKK